MSGLGLVPWEASGWVRGVPGWGSLGGLRVVGWGSLGEVGVGRWGSLGGVGRVPWVDGVVGFDRCGWGSLGGGRGLCSLGGVGRVP